MNFEARISKKGDLTMYRKMFSGIICLMLLGEPSLSPRFGPTYQIKNHRDCQRTHSGSWESASAGTYVFKLLDSNDRTLVAIYDADEMHVITTIQGIPGFRTETRTKRSCSSKSGPPANQKALKACSTR